MNYTLNKALRSIKDLWLYLLVAKRDMNRLNEMVKYSDLTPLQRKALYAFLKKQREQLDISEPKNY